MVGRIRNKTIFASKPFVVLESRHGLQWTCHREVYQISSAGDWHRISNDAPYAGPCADNSLGRSLWWPRWKNVRTITGRLSASPEEVSRHRVDFGGNGQRRSSCAPKGGSS